MEDLIEMDISHIDPLFKACFATYGFGWGAYAGFLALGLSPLAIVLMPLVIVLGLVTCLVAGLS
jgi:hypothetical protein